MRIFLTGAQGTGKSTIVKQLGEILPTHTVHDSMSKLFMNGNKDTQLKEDFQKMISLYCLNLYVNERDIICSRSYFDSIAYPSYYNEYPEIIEMVRYYKDMLFQDDCYYFYLPIEFDISQNGNDLRIVDPYYQRAIDSIIRREICTIDSDRVFCITGSVPERIDSIKRILDIAE